MSALAHATARLALAAALACAPAFVLAQDPPPASWVGVWLLHEPWHGSYAGTAYRLDASGGVTIIAMLDTNVRNGRRPRQVGTVARRRVGCRIGDRWRPGASPDRVVFAGSCTDGRARDIELSMAPFRGMPLTSEYVPRVLRVGGQRGWARGSGWDWALARCTPDPAGRCEDFERRPHVYRPDAPPPSP